MKINKKAITSSLLIVCISSSIITPKASAFNRAFNFNFNTNTNDNTNDNTNNNANDNQKTEDNIDIPVVDHGFSKDLNKAISTARFYFDRYKTGGNLIDLEDSLVHFGNIVTFMDDSHNFILPNEETPIHVLFYEQRDELYSIANNTNMSHYIVKYASEILSGWMKNPIVKTFPETFLEIGIVLYNEDKIESINGDLEKILEYYHEVLAYESDDNVKPPKPPTDEDNDENEDNSGEYIPIPPPEIDSGGTLLPDVNPDEDNNIVNENPYSINSYYKKEGNNCFKIEDKYMGSEIVSTSKNEVPKEDYVYCGIYDYVFNGNNNGGNTEVDNEYLQGDQNTESNVGIFYTVTKNELNPYYYNTGIRATVDGAVSYNQLKDVLYQISIKSKGFASDSNDKSLTILEGTPIVLKNNENEYSKSDTEALLDSFKKVGIKIMELESASEKTPIEEYINNNEFVKFKFNDKEFSMSNVTVDGAVVMAPVNELLDYLGLTLAQKDRKYTIKGPDNSITFELGSDKYIDTNNQEKTFLSKTRKINNFMCIELQTLCNEFGYSIEWDSESSIFIIK